MKDKNPPITLAIDPVEVKETEYVLEKYQKANLTFSDQVTIEVHKGYMKEATKEPTSLDIIQDTWL
jgi:hypothetical protein